MWCPLWCLHKATRGTNWPTSLWGNLLPPEYHSQKYIEIYLLFSYPKLCLDFICPLFFSFLTFTFYPLSLTRREKPIFKQNHACLLPSCLSVPFLFPALWVRGFSGRDALCLSTSHIFWQPPAYSECQRLRIVYLHFLHPKLRLCGWLEALGTDSPYWSVDKLQGIFFSILNKSPLPRNLFHFLKINLVLLTVVVLSFLFLFICCSD